MSLHNPIISANGSVLFAGDYLGPSLKVEARGDITFTGSIALRGSIRTLELEREWGLRPQPGVPPLHLS